EVSIYLDLQSDRLGLQVRFDGELRSPALFRVFEKRSSRSLDNILLKILDDEGVWDEDSGHWYVNSSASLEVVLGLIQEYDRVFDSQNQSEAIRFSQSLLDARLAVEWHETSAEIVMHWIFEDGTIRPKTEEVIGTGPYWVSVNRVLYRLSPIASRIASIFPYSSTISLTKAQMGPILEVLNDNLFDRTHVTVINEQFQPQTELKHPTPAIDLRRVDLDHRDADSNKELEILASLEFEYPEPPKGENIVYLPHRDAEREAVDYLKSHGFYYSVDRRAFICRGDHALDFLSLGKKAFPKEWRIIGFDEIRKGLKFSELTLNVSLAQSQSEDSGPIDWFDCHISLVQNNANVPISVLFKNRGSKSERWMKLDGGAFARVPAGGFGALETSLGMLDANFRLSNSIKKRLSPAQAISLAQMRSEQLQIKADKEFTRIAEKFSDFSGIDRLKETRSFVGKLRPYQRDGMSWMHFLHEFGFGGVLADEMGLGKTVQTLSLLQYLKGKKKLNSPSLIVVPTSIIKNWAYEAARFTPNLKILVLHGTERKDYFSKLSSYDLIITSYALLRIDRKELEKQSFHYVILDEAQNIKNFQAATTKAAKALKSQRRLALTGTPTENRPMELWSIFDFLMSGYLGSSEFFAKSIEKPILEGKASADIITFLNARTKPFILRRTKRIVEKDLPPKIETEIHVDMTPSQAGMYAQILQEVRPKVIDAIEEKGIRGASVSILAALLRLRQVCNHPNSIDAFKELQGYDSGKFFALQELISEALDSGGKILLYSQFLEMLSITRRWLDKEQIPYLYLDGSTKNRQDLVDQFNNDPKLRVFAMSLKAGGTGLNLTGADTVIIYDPWWNPAVEDQAADRAHRIGQTKTVNIYRLVTDDTVESRIMALKDKKSKLIDALLDPRGISPLQLTKSDIATLFAPSAHLPTIE
ncbi:MAG: DEAD/DEAH box helicase, partial [Bdellovibrionales bacterium]|nr:DEAD/DEAH box helicase [Bdellovibrionales bacterium]